MEMRRCRSLMLGRWHDSPRHHIEVENTEFLDWLGAFEGLRYLSLRGVSRITELPPSIGRLRCLEVLDLRACYDLQRLPTELAGLRRLQHLDISECHFLTHMPVGVGNLTNLTTLKGFKVASPQKWESCQLRELASLTGLRKLSISIARDCVLEEEQFNELRRLTALVSLTITWSVSASASRKAQHSGSSSTVLTVDETNYISPPPNLVKLDIRGMPQSTRPQWLTPSKLRHLTRLYIRGGHLSSQGLCAPNLDWPSVEVLRLRFLQGVDQSTDGLRKAFPNLRYLEVHQCNNSKFNYLWRPTSLRDKEEEA